MDLERAVDVVLRCFEAVERRDDQRLADLLHPDLEFHWPPSLSYGEASRGREAVNRQSPTWSETWEPLQPTKTEQDLSPRVVAASEDEVVVLWRQRGINLEGERFDSPVLGLYEVRDGKLVRAQMFYFEPEAAAAFLARAGANATVLQ
jgi:ketosteroid isomerase-like protein